VKIKVRCTVIVEVELTAEECGGVDPAWVIEENGCPGTGIVGSAIDAAIAENDAAGFCWACNLHGKNEVIEIDGRPVERKAEG